MSGKPRSPDSGQSEEEAVRAAATAFQQGIDREKNFAVLVERFYGPVFRFLARRRYSEDDRLDITQEVFLNVYRGLDGFRGNAGVGTWIFRIALNTCSRWVAREHSASPPGGEELTDELVDAEVSARAAAFLDGPLADLLAAEDSQRLRRSIARLPAQMRRCVELLVYRDMAQGEIAAALGISAGTVKAHLSHARDRLRGALQVDEGDKGS